MFYGCESLEKAVIKSRTKSLPKNFFWGCTNLTEIEFPSKLRFVRSSSLGCCDSLTKVTFPDNIFEMSGCFWDNDNLTTVVFGKSTLSLGYEMFGSCKNIRYLVIPESVQKFDDGIFSRYYGEITGITVITTAGSKAEKWAKSLDMNVSYDISDIDNVGGEEYDEDEWDEDFDE